MSWWILCPIPLPNWGAYVKCGPCSSFPFSLLHALPIWKSGTWSASNPDHDLIVESCIDSFQPRQLTARGEIGERNLQFTQAQCVRIRTNQRLGPGRTAQPQPYAISHGSRLTHPREEPRITPLQRRKDIDDVSCCIIGKNPGCIRSRLHGQQRYLEIDRGGIDRQCARTRVDGHELGCPRQGNGLRL